MGKLRDVLGLPYSLGCLSVLALLTLAICAFTGWPFWPAFVLLLFAVLINGLVAAFEDD
jgi:hypothetical protein